MARWKKPTKEQVLENRRTVARASVAFTLPEAVGDLRKGIGMTKKNSIARLTHGRQVAEIEAGTADLTGDVGEDWSPVWVWVGFIPEITIAKP